MNDLRRLLDHIVGFQWDAGNDEKNWLRHGVTRDEAEQVFEGGRMRLFVDEKHSSLEERYVAHGRSTAGRLLSVAFTIRASNIRVISARDMNRKERARHEHDEADLEGTA